MLKRVLTILLCACLVFATSACGKKEEKKKQKQTSSSSSVADNNSSVTDTTTSNSSGEVEKPKLLGANKYTDPSIYTIDTLVEMGIEEERVTDAGIQSKAEALEKKILDNPDTLKPADGGKYIYVANGGVDKRGYGLAPDTPVETIEYANLIAKEGDVVVLKRGHFWRTKVICKEGVSYGAYGEGNKPTIYGSLFNAVEKEWVKESTNIYKVQSGTADDIGLIVFDHGKAIGNKRHMKQLLTKDYDFYCSGGYLYVYSSKGDPSKLFSDIEFCHHEHIVKMKSNSTIQNWRIMYGGAHGIQTGGVKNITVDGCVVGYIGGTYQMTGKTVRFGNGIEVWGSCDGYTIKNCHVYQCYDAGITMQFQGATENTIIEQNILFEGNLLELNNYNIEYFLTPEPNGDSTFKNVSIKNNIIRDGGYGWGFYSRPDREYGCNVMGGGYNTAKNFVYTNNIFDNAKCHLLTISAGNAAWIPVFTGNTYAQYKDLKSFEWVGGKYYVGTQGNTVYTDRLGDKTATIILYDR